VQRGGHPHTGLLTAAVLAALVLFAGAKTASARDSGLPNPAQIYIAGVKYGMSGHTVKAILGPPHSIRRWRGASGRLIEVEWRFQDRLSVAFEVHNGRMSHSVNRVRTYSPRDRLPNGLHVNSRESAVRHKLPTSNCDTYSGGPPGPWPSGYICTWFPSGSASCAPNLTFYMRHQGGRVEFIELAGDVGEGC
jgi:hypothetical protein